MLSQKIKELRKKNGLTQEELADKLNVSRQAVTKWESGEGVPDIENLQNLSLYFHVSVDYLIGKSNNKINSLESKFIIIAIMTFFVGICFGIVSKSFEFGFVSCLLMPSIVLCISDIVLNKKYEKESKIHLQRQLQEKNLPTDFFGKILHTDDSARTNRIKNYLINSILDISVIELLTLVATLFGEDELILLNYNIVDNSILNNLILYVIEFAIGLIIFFLFEFIFGELKVKKYNKISTK